jgi:RimJ/RimL family protein N-acetyltransferase
MGRLAEASASIDFIDKHFRCFAVSSSGPVTVRRISERLLVVAADSHAATMDVGEGPIHSLTARRPLPDGRPGLEMALAVFETLLSTLPPTSRLVLHGDGWTSQMAALVDLGVVAHASDPVISSEGLFQCSELWMGPQSVYPVRMTSTDGVSHPVRPPKPQARIYSRFIPWLGGCLTFDVATTRDTQTLHRWMNDPRVAEFWKEDGRFEHQFAYLRRVIADPHMIPLICRFEGVAFGYFEIYWAKEDLIGRYYAADDYDRGFHVLIGEDAYRGKAWLTAWMTSILHLMFLSDPRTNRLVGEPQADHHQQLRNLLRSGFTHASTVNFPGKQAAIVHLDRQHYFANRLWQPREEDGKRGNL